MTRVALVTGGTGGIGTAICEKLYDDGYKVVAGYYSSGKHLRARAWRDKQKENGRDMDIAFGDIGDYNSTAECVKGIVDKYGSLDILINNGGITRDGYFKKMAAEQWRDVIKTNLDSTFNVTRAVYNGMLDNGYGRIVNISSINGQKGQAGQVNYSAAKAGMHGLSKALAQECADKGITVNTISPGYVATPMVSAIKPEILEKIIAAVPMKRLGKPEEIAGLVSYLVSDMAEFITGANIAINGGQHMS
ncbi:MAG: acetoacetyl-CoA reductase [Gammaproteobacteria bacterium]|nr:acetoacetyl-CoA reductase [Gammaproteobacteria bacterium]